MDTNLGGFDVVYLLLFFECHRGDKADGAVASPRVVERLDIIKDGKLSMAATGRNGSVQAGIGFKGAPNGGFERFRLEVKSKPRRRFL